MTPTPGDDAFAVEDPTLCPKCRKDSCEDHLPADGPDHDAAADVTDRPRIAFHRALDVMATPPPVEVVEGIAWAGCLSVLVSESGTGKTFVLLDLASAVSSGVRWHGRDVGQGSVGYLSFEGDALGLRLRAMRTDGRRLDHVYVLHGHDPLSPHIGRDGDERPSIGECTVVAALDALVAELATTKRPALTLMVIDTVRASLVGSEDNSDHVSAYQRAVRRIMAHVPGTATILAHHAGWQDGEVKKKRERGSSAWRGNCDATFYLEAGDTDTERGETELTLRTLKVRDAERPAPLHLIRRRVELAERAGADIRRGPLTLCIITRDLRTREDREAAQAQVVDAEHRQTDVTVLRVIDATPAMATSHNNIRAALAMRKADVGASLARLIQRGWVLPPDRPRKPYTLTPTGQQVVTGGQS